MRRTLPCLGALAGVALAASLAPAQYYPAPLSRPRAPDACGPGFYYCDPCGPSYYPSYYLVPPFPPVSGVMPPPGFGSKSGSGSGLGGPAGFAGNGVEGGAPPTFVTHPYARGPRDFFMFTEVQREKIKLERRPVLVP
jgi:hypothetical protein